MWPSEFLSLFIFDSQMGVINLSLVRIKEQNEHKAFTVLADTQYQ